MNEKIDTQSIINSINNQLNSQSKHFDDTINRLINANDTAHAELSENIKGLSSGQQDIKDDIHKISSDQNLITNNQQSQEKNLDDFKKLVSELSNRLDSVEEKQNKWTYLGGFAGWLVAGSVVLITIANGIVRLFF